MEVLSEGVAAVKSVDPEEKVPNAEVDAVSATEERVVDEVSGWRTKGKSHALRLRRSLRLVP